MHICENWDYQEKMLYYMQDLLIHPFLLTLYIQKLLALYDGNYQVIGMS
jgi:hypothetical protein